MHNERREDSDMRRLFDAIKKVGEDFNEQHIETQKTLNKMNRAHTVFHTKLSAVEETLGRVGTKVDVATERAAAIGAIVDTLRGQNKDQYERLTEIEGDVKVLSGKPGGVMPFAQTDNFKWLVGSAIFCALLVLLAFGAITVSDIKEINPIGGE